MCDLIG